jgi:hypothetical protein
MVLTVNVFTPEPATTVDPSPAVATMMSSLPPERDWLTVMVAPPITPLAVNVD